MDLSIKQDKNRFYVEINGKTSELQYKKIDEKTLDYQRTFVPEELREQGIAGKIVKHALEYAKENDYKIIPSCDFVQHYIDQHPEYKGLIKK